MIYSFSLIGPIDDSGRFLDGWGFHCRQNRFPPMGVEFHGNIVNVSVPSPNMPEREVRKSLNMVLSQTQQNCRIAEPTKDPPAAHPGA
jgi:hypothetical protein